MNRLVVEVCARSPVIDGLEPVVCELKAPIGRVGVRRVSDPGNPDDRRLQVLHKLYLRVKEHRGLDEVREFKEAVLNREDEERSDA